MMSTIEKAFREIIAKEDFNAVDEFYYDHPDEVDIILDKDEELELEFFRLSRQQCQHRRGDPITKTGY
jgi:hypothetical protein